MNILDYVILGILAIAFLIGIIKGFSGMFFGVVSVLVSLGIAVAATVPIAAALTGTQDTLADTIVTKLTEGEETNLFTYDVYKVQNTETQEYELYMIVPADDETNEILKFEDALSKLDDGGVGGTLLGLFSSPIQNAILTNLEVGEGQANAAPFANYLSHIFAKILLYVIVFVVLFIVVLILFRILASVSDKLMEYKAMRAIDRLLGLVVSLGIAAGIIVGAVLLTYTYLGGNATIAGYLDGSMIVSIIKNSDIAEKVLAGIASSSAAPAEEPEEVEAFVQTITTNLSILPPKLG